MIVRFVARRLPRRRWLLLCFDAHGPIRNRGSRHFSVRRARRLCDARNRIACRAGSPLAWRVLLDVWGER